MRYQHKNDDFSNVDYWRQCFEDCYVLRMMQVPHWQPQTLPGTHRWETRVWCWNSSWWLVFIPKESHYYSNNNAPCRQTYRKAFLEYFCLSVFFNVLLKLARIIQRVQTGLGSNRVMTGYWHYDIQNLCLHFVSKQHVEMKPNTCTNFTSSCLACRH